MAGKLKQAQKQSDGKHVAKIRNRLAQSILQGNLRLPAQLLAGQRNVRLPLARIVGRQRLGDEGRFRSRHVDDHLGEPADGELAGIAEIDRAGDVVAAFHQGHSAETITQQYPALSLEEVYGAIAHYLANRDDVDQYLRRQDEVWKQLREKANAVTSPVVQRLRRQAAEAEAEAP